MLSGLREHADLVHTTDSRAPAVRLSDLQNAKAFQANFPASPTAQGAESHVELLLEASGRSFL